MEREYNLEKLRGIQKAIAAKVILKDSFQTLKSITGFDLAFLNNEAIVAAVTVDYDTVQIIEKKAIRERVLFPYIPTFLGFREGPPIIKLVRELKIEPEVLMLDSHGISHPLFCGCASHVGVLTNKPTIGVAKSRLCGEYVQKPKKTGEWASLKYKGRKIGAFLLSKKSCNPIFVSSGHMITLETTIEIVNHLLSGYKIPEPLRLAHNFANKIKRELR